MELEVGMYVRTNDGLIAKYIGYRTDKDIEYNRYLFDGKIYWYYEYYNNYVYEEDFKEWFEEEVIKKSHNIIDLIEAGDYVNGKKVIDKQYHYTDKDNYDMGEWCIFYENEALGNYQKEIQSIVTKEQFSAMEYRLGDE